MKVKKMFMSDLIQKSIKELIKMRNELRKELFGMKMKNAIKGLKETHLIPVARKDIARINTALTLKIKEKYGNNLK